jgi:hypothetical protein
LYCRYGLVYPGVGWVIWREKEDLPEDMVFHINYLGSDQANITLNFSRPAAFILAQYYQLVRLGREGYTTVMTNLMVLAQKLAEGLVEMGEWSCRGADCRGSVSGAPGGHGRADGTCELGTDLVVVAVCTCRHQDAGMDSYCQMKLDAWLADVMPRTSATTPLHPIAP